MDFLFMKIGKKGKNKKFKNQLI